MNEIGNTPLVSVIIPCYNHGQYLMQCIASVKTQTYSNIEIIVVNDGSTNEDTLEVLKSIHDEQIQIIHKQNGGLAAARNTGIDACKGDIILPLDADDYIGDSYVEKAVNLLLQDDNIGLVNCRGQYFGTRNHLTDNIYTPDSNMLLYNSFFNCSIYRKSDFLYIGKYNTNMTKGYEDWDMNVRMMNYKSKVVQLTDVLFFYRQTNDSMLDALVKSKESRIEMENVLFKNNIDIYIKHYDSIIGILREYQILKIADNSINEAIASVHNTLSYRIGDFILKPFKFIKSNFSKK